MRPERERERERGRRELVTQELLAVEDLKAKKKEEEFMQLFRKLTVQ